MNVDMLPEEMAIEAGVGQGLCEPRTAFLTKPLSRSGVESPAGGQNP